MRVWTYVITVDAGAAPNFEPPSTTFVLCKPQIRKHAGRGDLVLAFNGRRLNRREPHSVRWAGVVTEVMPMADYWDDPRFQVKKVGRCGTPDNIYLRLKGGGMVQTPNRTHGPADVGRDVRGVNALVLGPSWHACAGASAAVLPEPFGLRMVTGRRAHRRCEIDDTTWRRLERWLDAHLSNPPAPQRAPEKPASCAPKALSGVC